MLMIALLSLYGFSSCSKDDDVVVDTNFMYQKKFYTTDPVYDLLFGTKNGANYVILDFSSKTQVEWYVIQGGQIKSVLSTFTYVCKEDNTVEITSEEGKTAIYMVTSKQMKKINDDGLRYTSLTIWTDQYNEFPSLYLCKLGFTIPKYDN